MQKNKKSIGVGLVLIGFVTLVTSFTPGSWWIFIGLEFIGIRILFLDKKSVVSKICFPTNKVK